MCAHRGAPLLLLLLLLLRASAPASASVSAAPALNAAEQLLADFESGPDLETAFPLDIEVTAEGVETDEQYRVLASMGCNTFQGYRFSMPLAPEALELLLETPAPLPAARVA